MSALRRQISVFIRENLSPEARAARFASIAMRSKDRLIAEGRASPRYQTFVDGREGADERTVRGDGGGVIIYQFSYIGDVVAFAVGFLRARAPAHARDTFFVAINGRFIRDVRMVNPDHIPPDAEIIIGNRAGDSRKFDVQLVGFKQLHYKLPPKMFADCARAVNRRFGNVVKARRLYTAGSFPGQHILERGPKAGRAVETPAIIINSIG